MNSAGNGSWGPQEPNGALVVFVYKPVMNFWYFAIHGQCLGRKTSTGTLHDQKKETFLCNALVLCLIVTCKEGKMTKLEAGGWSLSYCAFEATRHYILTGRIVIETQVLLNKLCKKCICFIN